MTDSSKWPIAFLIPRPTCYCIIHLVPSLPMPGVRMQILWIFLRSKMELFWYIYLFIYLFIAMYFLFGCFNTKNYFPNCTKPLALSGKYFWLILFFYFPLNLFYSPTVNGEVLVSSPALTMCNHKIVDTTLPCKII